MWKSAVSGRKTDGVEPSRVKAIVMEAVKYLDTAPRYRTISSACYMASKVGTPMPVMP